jgi:hypothetical protein
LIDSQDFFPLEWVLLTLLTKLRECWYKECLFYASVMFFFFCRTILYWRSLKWNNKPTDGIIFLPACSTPMHFFIGELYIQPRTLAWVQISTPNFQLV